MNIINRSVSRDYLRNGKLNIKGGSGSYLGVSSYGSISGNYLPATFNADGTYTVDLSNVTFTGNIIAEGEVTAYGSGESGGSSGNVAIYDGLDSTASDVALSANLGRILKSLIDNIDVGGITVDLTDYYKKTEVDTLLAGYSKTDHTHKFSEIKEKPTTLSGYGITDAATKNHTHTSVGSFTTFNITKSDNGGFPTWMLIADITTLQTLTQNGATFGFTGLYMSRRTGNLNNETGFIVASASWNKDIKSLKSTGSYVRPYIVKYNSKYYIALKLSGSNKDISFWGYKTNLLTEFVELYNTTAETLPAGLEIVTEYSHYTLYNTRVTYDGSGNKIVDTYATKTELTTHSDNTTKHITATERSNWNTAYNNNHTHSNKTVLDGITSTKISNWDTVYSNWNKVFTIDSNGDLKVKVNVIGEKEISAYGAGTSSGGSSGVDIVDALTSTRTDAALSANQGKVLKGLIDSFDFSDYYSKTEVDNKLSAKSDTTHSHTNYLTLTSAQTITGAKTFDNGVTITRGNSILDDNGWGIIGINPTGWTGLPSDGSAIGFGTGAAPVYIRTNGSLFNYIKSDDIAYTILDSKNYSSYALPKAGGTMKTDSTIVMQSNVTTGSYIGSSAWQIMAFSSAFQIKPADYGSTNFSGGLSMNKSKISFNNNEMLHSNNYSSYALPLTGGTITNTGTGMFINRTADNANPHICFKAKGTSVGDIGISYDGSKPIWYNYNTSSWNDIITSDNLANYTVNNSTKFAGVSMRDNNKWTNNALDANIMYTIDATALSTSTFYPIIWSATLKDLYVRMYSTSGSSSAAYNQNKLEFTFRGLGWNDTPSGLTVHFYNCYTASETTIGCIGMGQEAGHKVVWVRGGLTYYIISNMTPSLKTASFTSGNEVYVTGTSLNGGSNTKVTTYWTPQTTSGLGTLYHSGGIALGGGISIAGSASVTGTLKTTGLATFNGNFSAPAGTTDNMVSNSFLWRDGAVVTNPSTAGWYRFAVSKVANNTGGTYIFSIRRSYYNTNNESYIIAATVDYGGCNWTQLAGNAQTQLITKIRCTYTNNGTMYFDFYYNSTALNHIYVNAIGNCTMQTPTLTTSALSYSNETSLTNGFKVGTKSAYLMTLYRNASSGGSFIMYGANNQLTKTWAAGCDNLLRFGWYYKDTSAGTDLEKMWLDSTGNLYSDNWTLCNVATNPYLKLVYNSKNWYIQCYNEKYLYLGQGSTKSLRIDDTGNVLSVGEVTAHSDRRLKSNIKPLEVRGELNPVTYTKDGKESIGFIADEVKEVYPELVITDDSTEEKYLSLNYAQLTAVLYAEIKELKERITQLENK